MEKAAKDEALLAILSALGSGAQEEASPSKKASANTGLSYAASVDREDPVKPLPWTGFPEVQEEVTPMPYYSDSFVPETTFSGAVSFAGGLDPEAQSVLGGLGMPGGQDMVGDRTVTDLEDLDVTPMRRRRSSTVEALAAAKDAFDFISGVDPNSYMGKTLELMNKYDKTRMEEDPEGYQADMNRAKVLSQKAQEETDPVKRAIYGREIKKLLPKETEGLSDEVAADYFTAGLDNKLKLEQLKGYNKLQQIQAQNKNKLDVQSLKNMSASEIANAKNQTQWDIASLNNEYKKAISDGNNERALTVAQMITDRQETLANLNNAAKLKQEEMRQTEQTKRTQYTADRSLEGRMYAADKGYEAREYATDKSLEGRKYAADKSIERAQIAANASLQKKGEMTPEQARIQWPNIEAKFRSDQASLQEGLDLLDKYEMFGPIIGRQLSYGIGNDEQLEAFGRVKQILTEAVQSRLEQVRKAAGTGRAADSEKEGARVIGLLTGEPTIPQAAIKGALKQFMATSEKAMRLRKQELFGPDSAGSSNKIKSIKRIG